MQVCNTYGGMFNDMSLIQYGFVQEQPQPPHLYGVDRHDFVFDPYDMWVNQRFTKVLPEPFTSSEQRLGKGYCTWTCKGNTCTWETALNWVAAGELSCHTAGIAAWSAAAAFSHAQHQPL